MSPWVGGGPFLGTTAAVELTASLASGYLTNVQWTVAGDRRVLEAHFSSPSNGCFFVRTGMPYLTWWSVDQADPVTYYSTTDGGFGQLLYFSGWVTGATGQIRVEGY